MSFLAIDIGSSACKAVVFTAEGDVLAQSSNAYSPDFPRPGFAEMDPEKFWSAICSVCRTATKNVVEPVQALCLSSHGETFVALDDRGRPLAPAILNQDNRAIPESEWCVREIGRKRLFEITGLVAHPMYPIPKILWLKRNEYNLFSSASRFVTLIGYLLHRMELPPFVDYSLASRFLAFDIRKLCWSEEILDAVGLCRDRLPEPVPAGTLAGKLGAEAARALGLAPATMVVLGGHDQPCGALGVGVIGQGRVADSIGTYECLLGCSDEPCLSEGALAASLNSYCHVVPEKFVTLAYFPSGIMVKWFHDLIYSNGDRAADHLSSEAEHYSLLEADEGDCPSGLCVTPHLIGTCNPEFNPQARAVIAGLNAGTTRAQIYKGILEGLACELSLLTEVLADAVGEFDDIFVYGGGTRSGLGLRLRASLTGRRLHLMARQEAVCLGTAILGAVAAGEYKNISEAVDHVVSESTVLDPESAVTERYQKQQDRYRLLRAAVTSTNWI